MNDLFFLALSHPRVKNRYTILTLEDSIKVLKHNTKWYLNNKGYAIGYSKLLGQRLNLHRLVLNVEACSRELQIDHINRDRCDNRRCNLKLVDRKKNWKNSAKRSYRYKKRSGLSSKFYNVSWSKKAQKWVVILNKNGKQIYGGYFLIEEDAARKANELMTIHAGKNAILNIV